MLIVGGIGSIWGAIIGTIVIRLIQEGLTFLGPQLAEMSGIGNGQIVFASMNIILGLAIMVSIIFARKGLIGILPKIIPSARQTSKRANKMLSVNNLKVIYQNVILGVSDVTLRVPAGGIVALLGANGAGKSTTLRAISSLLDGMDGEITNGNIEYQGKSLLGIGTRDIVKKELCRSLKDEKFCCI